MKIFVLSDTHIPRTANDLPFKLYEEIQKCDLIIHAGDIVEKSFYDKLKNIKDIKAVYGNMDSTELKNVLQQKEIINAGKFKIGLIHGWGSPDRVEENIRKEFKDVDVIIYGHTHIPKNEIVDGVLFFNPGSPTDKTFAPCNSYGILKIGDSISGEIIEI